MTWDGTITRLLHRSAGQHGPVMLMYHAITHGKAKPCWPWAISMRQFRNQLDFLASEGYATPTMGELVAKPGTWAGRTSVITFDDGYLDNMYACEELQKRGMRATWFVVAGSIGESPKWPADGRPEGRLLNAGEMREMLACGMEIGSHTVNHIRLTEADDLRLKHELLDSKAMLEDLLGTLITSFAYPYGAYDDRCTVAVKRAGYYAACTTRSGWALRDHDPYRLRRLTVFNNDSINTFVRNLCFGDNKVTLHKLLGYKFKRMENWLFKGEGR